jgi:hypothetical protein
MAAMAVSHNPLRSGRPVPSAGLRAYSGGYHAVGGHGGGITAEGTLLSVRNSSFQARCPPGPKGRNASYWPAPLRWGALDG